jgi:hypothetical protein
MPYIIKEFEDGFKVCKEDEPTKCFSKKPLPKKRAVKQMKAIGMSGGKIKRTREEIEAYNANLEAERKKREANKGSIRCPADRLYDENKQYKGNENVCLNNADGTITYVDLGKIGYEPCFIGKNFYGHTTPAKCKQMNIEALDDWEKKNHPENYYFFRPALKAITKVGDVMMDVVPMPEIVKDVYKVAREGTRQSIEGYGRPIDKFFKQLKTLKLNPETYLTVARRVAEREGYDPAKLDFANNNDNKLKYDSPEGIRYFGKAGYGDYIIWCFKERNNDAPQGYADMKRNVFRKSHGAMTKKYKLGKYSPNELAIRILW